MVTPATATATQPLISTRDFGLDPDLIGIGCPLAEWMTQCQGAEDDFNQVPAASLKCGDFGTQRRGQRGIYRAAFFNPENVHAQCALQELMLGFFRRRIISEVSDPRVGPRKKMMVNCQHLAGRFRVVKFSPKISRGRKRHVTGGTILFCRLGIIETARTMARNSTEQIGVIMILAAEEFLVLVEFGGQAHFVASRAKLSGLVEGFQKGFLVKLRLG